LCLPIILEGSKMNYNFYYWGPLLFKIKLRPQDLKKCAKLCSKKVRHFNKELAGIIKHEHIVDRDSLVSILLPYLSTYRHSYEKWYGSPLTKKINMLTAWVNFMKAGEFNPPHVHTKCDLSSVLFIKITEDIKKENEAFKGKGGGPGSLSFTYGEKNPLAISGKSFLPEEGDFFYFPGDHESFCRPLSIQRRTNIHEC